MEKTLPVGYVLFREGFRWQGCGYRKADDTAPGGCRFLFSDPRSMGDPDRTGYYYTGTELAAILARCWTPAAWDDRDWMAYHMRAELSSLAGPERKARVSRKAVQS